MQSYSSLSADEITLLNVNQLKYAWQQEHDDRIAEAEVNKQLETELIMERASSELAVLCSTYPGDPCLLVNAMESFLPQHIQDEVSLTCFIRVGDSWASIQSTSSLEEGDHINNNNNNNNNINETTNTSMQKSQSNSDQAPYTRSPHIIQSNFLDSIAHESQAGKYQTLKGSGSRSLCDRFIFNDIMGYKQKQNANVNEKENQQSNRGYSDAVGESKTNNANVNAFGSTSTVDFLDDIRRSYDKDSNEDTNSDVDDDDDYDRGNSSDINYDRVLNSSYVIATLTRSMWFVTPKNGSAFRYNRNNRTSRMNNSNDNDNDDRDRDRESENGYNYENGNSSTINRNRLNNIEQLCYDAVNLMTGELWFTFLKNKSNFF